MVTISLKASKLRMIEPYIVKDILCKPMDGNIIDIINIDDQKIFGHDTVTIKVSEECRKAIDVIAEKYHMSVSELIRKTWLWIKSNPQYVRNPKYNLEEMKEKICAGMVLYEDYVIIKAPELDVEDLPTIRRSNGECYKVMKQISKKYHISATRIKRKVLWLME